MPSSSNGESPARNMFNRHAGELREVMLGDGTKSYQYVESWDYAERQYTQQEASYDAVGGGNTQACSNCRWFVGPSRCAIVSGEIAPNGKSDMWAAVPTYTPEPIPVIIMGGGKEAAPAFPNGKGAESAPTQEPAAPEDSPEEKSLIERITGRVVEALKSLVQGTPPIPPVHAGTRAFTCYKEANTGRVRFMAVMTNNFKDREGEVFTEAAHTEYVDWAEKNQNYPELWLWHTPGSKFGQIDWLDYASGFVVASGYIDQGKEYIAENLAASGEELGVSHGFVCLKDAEGTIHQYRSYEASPLPLSSAANEWTPVNFLGLKEIDEMPFSDTRRAFLTKMVGEEAAKEWETNVDALGTKLKELGIEYKSQVEGAPEGEPKPDGEGGDEQEEPSKVLAGEVATLTKSLNDLLGVVSGFKGELEAAQAEAKKNRDTILTEELTARTQGLPTGYRASTSEKSVAQGTPVQEQTDDWFGRLAIGPVTGQQS